jgi:hypothetical protein
MGKKQKAIITWLQQKMFSPTAVQKPGKNKRGNHAT